MAQPGADDFRAQGHLAFSQFPLTGNVSNSGAQQPQGLCVAAGQFVHQALNGDLLFQLSIFKQAEGVLIHLGQTTTAGDRVKLTNFIERPGNPGQHGVRHGFASQTQLPHGVEIGDLVLIGPGTIRHTKKHIVGTVKKFRQNPRQGPGRCVPQPNKRSRQFLPDTRALHFSEFYYLLILRHDFRPCFTTIYSHRS